MDRGAWRVIVHGVTVPDMTEQLTTIETGGVNWRTCWLCNSRGALSALKAQPHCHLEGAP